MRRVSAKASNTVEINTPTRFESGQYLCSFINALYLPSLLDANWIPDMIIMVESTGYGRAKIRIAPSATWRDWFAAGWFRYSCRSRLAYSSAAGAGHFPMARAAFECGWAAATVRQIYVFAGPQECRCL